jgi:hypothetical protein
MRQARPHHAQLMLLDARSEVEPGQFARVVVEELKAGLSSADVKKARTAFDANVGAQPR